MRRRLPPLASLRAFEAAAHFLSFKKAGEDLGVTPTAISHQVRLLEEFLGVKLFERRVRQVTLTAAGRTLFPALQEGLDRFEEAVGRVAAQRETPIVVLTTTTAFAAHWLMPRLARLRAAHPELTLSLLATEELVSLESGQADIAIRLGGGMADGYDVVPFIRDRFAPMASPALEISGEEAFERLPLIDFDWSRPMAGKPDWPSWFEAAGLSWLTVAPTLHFNQESHALQAAIAGQGIVLFSLTLAAEPLAQGHLCQPFETTISGGTYSLRRAQRVQHSPHTQSVWHWLLEEAGRSCSQEGHV